jgi:tape measure domain-containing protein
MDNDNGKSVFIIELDNGQLRVHATESKNILHSIGKTAQTEGNNIDAAFSKIGKTIGGVFAVSQLKAFASQVVSLRGEIQSLQISFETLAGKTKGDELFKSIREFAVQTPMMLKDLASGAQTMLAFNIDVENVMPMLQAIGDISMGDAQKFQSLTLAFSQMSATGKLMGQDLLQMINAGFNPLSVISEKTGKSIGVLKEEMEKGKITTQMVTEAFKAASSEGGKFNGMLEKQSKGINGAISNLQGAIDDMMNNIGTSTESVTMSLIDVGTSLAKNYEQVGRVIAGLITTYGTYRAAMMTVTAIEALRTAGIGAMTTAEAIHYGWIVAVEKAHKLLNATMLNNPYVLVATLIAGVVAALISLKTETERVKDAENDYNAEKQKAIEKEQEHRREIDNLCDVAGNEAVATDTRKEALVKLIQKYPEVFKKYKTETEMLEHIRDVKREIAELDGKSSVTNAKNELPKVEKRIRELETKAGNGGTITGQSTAGSFTQDVKGLTKDEEAELKMLYKKRTELNKQSHKDDVDAYFKDLTGISNTELDNEIKARENLIAKMKMTGAKHGKLSGASATTGTYTQSELEGQLELLQAQKDYRGAGSKSSADWAAEAKKTYDDALEKYNNYVNNSKNKVKKEDYEEKQKELKAAVETAKKEYEKFKPITDKDADKASRQAAQEEKKENHTTVEIAKRNQEIEDIKNAQIKATRDAELEARQDRLNLEKDSVDKTLQQIEIDKERMENAIEDRENDLLEKYRDVMEKQWQNENPNAKDQGLSFDRTSVTMADMLKAAGTEGNAWLQQELAAIKESRNIANAQAEKATAEAYKKLIEDVQTYEQQRTKVEKQYEEQRKSLYEKDGTTLRQGVTEANVAEVNRNEEEALAAVDQEFASREGQFQAWCNSISNYSLEALQNLLKKAKDELDEMENDGDVSPETLAMARAMVAKLREEIKQAKAEQDQLSPDEKALKKWNKLYDTLQDLDSAFNSLGGTVDGTVGDILSAAGSITTSTLSMINSITNLSKWSVTATKMAAEGASQAMITIEKASVILTAIGAAMSVISTIAGLFNSDSKKQKEIDKLQDIIDELERKRENADAIRAAATLKQGSYLEMVRDAINGTRSATISAAAATNDWQRVWQAATSKMSKNSTAMAASVDKITSAYANMSYSAGKAFGNAHYDTAREQLQSLAQQQVLIQEQIDDERSKKNSDSDQIKEWEQQIEELGQEAADVINDLVEEIIGGSAEDIADTLGDALIEAFADGEDAAEAWGDSVQDIVKNVVKNLIIQSAIMEPLNAILDNYKQQWYDENGNFLGIDTVLSTIPQLSDDLMAAGESAISAFDTLPDNVKELIYGDASRTANSTGITAASQETVDELNGRATAIQGHTYSISENTKLLVSNTQDILRSVMNIESETSGLAARMSRMESSMKTMNTNIESIALKGVKLKN